MSYKGCVSLKKVLEEFVYFAVKICQHAIIRFSRDFSEACQSGIRLEGVLNIADNILIYGVGDSAEQANNDNAEL